MIEFRTELENYLIDKATTLAGPGTDPTNYVHTFDNHLHDFNLELTPNPWPFLVVAVRTVERSSSSEIGVTYDLYMWTVHLYYLDLTPEYNPGSARRNTILGKLVKSLEEDRRLGNLEVFTGPHREYVYDTNISAVLFDSSGQEEEYSFVSELYLNVYTAKS